ncbi:MAG: class I SAM-dependent methyltransferase [Coleofasciculaceae cyanobacterium SM2_1_6]|nr:class I SAM-dependent methyltransferase [Coleofasciculaceae cyanobacterium SM2_1_6]
MISEIIYQQIQQSPQHRITFAAYMDLALYHPQHGYYATGRVNIGDRGDFFTAPHLGADFGELLGKQLSELWEIMGRPEPWQLVEMGAGQGLIAIDMLRYLQREHPELFGVLEYLIIEKSPALIKQQQQNLESWAEIISKVRWCSWEEIPENSLVGCCFSNELVDAFPVHLWTIEAGELREIYVTAAAGEFREVVGEISTPRLQDYWQLTGIKITNYPEGYRSEVNLAALDWLTIVAGKLQRGYVITIDYGYEGDRYYSPGRNQGTLQCYYRHRHHANPYIHVGQQDITAHVNFTALQQQGKLLGLESEALTKQGLFLMELGLGDRLAALSSSTSGDPLATPQELIQIMQRRQTLHQLIDPHGLGGFGVLVQSKTVQSIS